MTFTGGALAGSDESNGDRAIDFAQYNNYFYGKVPAGVSGVGLTAMTPNYTGGNAFTTDQSLFINTSRGVIHTAFLVNPVTNDNEATTVSGVSGTVYQRPVTARTITASKTVEFCAPNSFGAKVIPDYDPSHGATSQTFTLTCTVLANPSGNFVGLPPSGVVTAAGSEWVEQVNFTATGLSRSHTQAVTAAFRYPNGSLNLWFGGLQGYAFSIDNDVATTASMGPKMRSLYYALGSLDRVNLAYAFQSYGSTTGPSRMPDSTVASTPATGSITLYPYAEVVANTSNRYDPLFEPNIVNFKPGDTVEDPFFGPINWKVEAQDININTPCYASGECEARLVTMHGAAIGYGATVDKFVNSNNPGKYTNQGGNLPLPGITTVYGPFGYAYHFDTAPAGFFFSQNFNGTAPICIVCWGHASSQFQYKPSTFAFNVIGEFDADTVVAKQSSPRQITAVNPSGDTHILLGANTAAEHKQGPVFDLEDSYGAGFFHVNQNGVVFSGMGSTSPLVSIDDHHLMVGNNEFTVDPRSGAITTQGTHTFTGTCPASAKLTVKNGLIVACN